MKSIPVMSLLLVTASIWVTIPGFSSEPVTRYSLNIAAISSDSAGFLWVASEDALLRYDGYTYHPIPRRDNALLFEKGNHVNQMEMNGEDVLCLYTARGIFFYDTRLHVLSKSAVLPEAEILSVASRPHSDMAFLNTTAGIYSYSEKKDAARLILKYSEASPGLSATSSRYLSVDEDGTVWTVNNCTLLRLRPDAGSPNLEYTVDSLAHFKDNYTLYRDRFGVMYLYNKDNLLSGRYDERLRSNRFSVEFEEVTAMLETEDELIIALRGKGCRRIVRTRNGTVLSKDSLGERVLTEHDAKRVNTLYLDRKGNLWCGTRMGVLRLNETYSESLFKFVAATGEAGHTLSSSIVRDIALAKDGSVWLATSRGLDHLRLQSLASWTYETQSFKVPVSLAPGVRRDNLRQVEFDRDGMLWVGSEEGILLFDTDRCEFVASVSSPDLPAPKNIHAIASDSSGNVWLGYDDTGLYRYSLDTGHAEPIRFPFEDGESLDYCRVITVDRNGFVWANSGNRCLVRFSPGEGAGKARRFEFRDSDGARGLVTCLFADPTNTIWCGTSDGLYLFDHERESFSKKDLVFRGVSSYINSIINDQEGNLWLGLPEGVCRYHVNDDKTQCIPLLGGQMSEPRLSSASVSDGRGVLYMTGVNGLTCFDPRTVTMDKTETVCYFSDFRVNGESLEVGDGILREDINVCRRLDLKHSCNNVSFSFSSLTYEAQDKIRYCHRLTGVDQDWVYDGTAPGNLSYSNIKRGSHLLQIRCTNPLGQWQEPRTLELFVKPPLLLSLPAILMYLALLAGLSYVILKRLTLRADRQRDEAVKKSRADLYRDLTMSLKNPLTILQSSLTGLLSSGQGLSETQRRQMLLTAEHGGKRIGLLIDQLEQFSDLLMNDGTLELKRIDFVPFFRTICESFRPLFKPKGILYEFKSETDTIPAEIDRAKVESIFFGLMSFLYKFASHDSQVSVRCVQEGPAIQVRMTGNVTGLKTSDLDGIFDHTKEDNDIGLSLVLAKEFALLHGGSVSADLDGGELRLTLSLPASAGLAVNSLAADDGEDSRLSRYIEAVDMVGGVSLSGKKGRLRVTLITKDASLGQYVKDVFSPSIRTEVFSSLSKAVEENLLKTRPDAVICEVRFEGLKKGLDLCRGMKSAPATADMPFIFISTIRDDATMKECYRSGADAFIPKPFDVDFLQVRVLQLIQGRHTLRSAVKQEFIISPKEVKVSSSSEQFLQRAMKVIESNMDNEAFRMEDFATAMNMSLSMLHRRLKDTIGQSPAEFCRLIRLKRGAQLLLSDAYTVSEIASRVGFQDVHYFSTCFKRVYGETPTEYKVTHSDLNQDAVDMSEPRIDQARFVPARVLKPDTRS